MYIDLMEGSQTIQELSNNLSRARRQKIYINLKQL